MRPATLRSGRPLKSTRTVAWLTLAVAVASLALAGCGSSGGGGGGGTPPGPDPNVFAVHASPPGGTFPTGSAVPVTLTATGPGSESATIYYTTDLSIPSAASPMYTGPVVIPASTDTVLKFYAVDAATNETGVVTEGYVFGNPGTLKGEWAESGHGQIAAEAWRHWDEDGAVQTSCAKCHAGGGFKDWALDGVIVAPAALPMGLECAGCHTTIPNTLYDDVATFAELDHVEFPSGETVTLAGQSNLCIACHQGRASKVQIDGAAPNTVVQTPTDYDSFDFINIHYYAAAASYFGHEVLGGYEYAGLTYNERNTFPSHPDGLSTCTGCHMREGEADHSWAPDLARCQECHSGGAYETLGGTPGINHAAITAALPQLYAAIQAYAIGLGYPVVYDSHAYPYWFNDNGNGASFPNRYRNFDDVLLQAAYNYQFGLKEPCGYIHNGLYMRQLLHDSIVALGAVPSDKPAGRAGYTAPSNLFAAKTDEFHLSGHDHAGGDAFRHWDKDPAPQTVPADCARCHTSPGFVDWAPDGTVTVTPSPVSVVGCIACHESGNLYANDETRWDEMSNTALRPVLFPSGDTADLGGTSNVCMGCHQGRESGVDVQDTIDGGPGPYSFLNIHYYPAAAIFFGVEVEPGYQYRADTAYNGQTTYPAHGGGLDNCRECHLRGGYFDHTFLPQLQDCAPCHGDPVLGWKDQFGGSPGFSYTEIQSLLTDLYAAIQAYASGTLLKPIFYDAHAYPYFFNAPGLPIFPNQYVDFDATLLKAAYNYQVGQKEPCGYIHNGRYMRQILYDALDDLDNGAQDNSVAGHSRP